MNLNTLDKNYERDEKQTFSEFNDYFHCFPILLFQFDSGPHHADGEQMFNFALLQIFAGVMTDGINASSSPI